MGVEQNKMDELFKWDGKPDVAPTISLALQHLVAMIIGCVTPAIIISNVAGLEIGQRIILIQASLTMSAICTFFQLFPLKKGVFGAGLPMILGISFAYLPSMQAIAGEGGGVGTIVGAMMVGGIVAINREIDAATAEELNKIFLEIVIAPSYSPEALEVLKNKKNLRVIQCEVPKPQDKFEYIKVDGGILVQETNKKMIDEMKIVTEKQPTEQEKQDMILGMKVVKHVKSNAIVVVKDGAATGIGTGQTNRIWATAHALEHAKGDLETLEGAVLASDAFFPFRDCVDEAAKYGIKAIVQPGGSIRDEESVQACNEHGISMALTGIRHFKH